MSENLDPLLLSDDWIAHHTARYQDQLGNGTLQEWADELLALAKALKGIVDRSGLDISPCTSCDLPVFCIPDGMPMCETCAEKENPFNAANHGGD